MTPAQQQMTASNPTRSDLPSNCLSINGVAYCVGAVPERKSVALYRCEGVVIDVVGYFTDAAKAETFRAWLVGISGEFRRIDQRAAREARDAARGRVIE